VAYKAYGMTVNDEGAGRDSSGRERARLRRVGVIVLLVGIGTACIVYWMGTRSADLTDNPALAGYSRSQSRQMGLLYGKMGLFIDDLWDELKRPGTQAILIAATSALVASGCFYLARWSDDGGKTL
jgi:hypothetical protein